MDGIQVKTESQSLKKGVFTGARFILFVLFVAVVSTGIFKLFIEGSFVFSVLFETKDPSDGVNVLTSSQSPGANAGPGFYVPDEFPVIYLGDVWARITIDDAGVSDVPVLFGDSAGNLKKGVGHFDGSRFCGQRGNIVLSGHVTRPFGQLENLKVGAVVKMNTIYGEYVYKVESTLIFNENDVSPAMPTDGEERLTIYTCYPAKNPMANKTERFAVICSKISGRDWMMTE